MSWSPPSLAEAQRFEPVYGSGALRVPANPLTFRLDTFNRLVYVTGTFRNRRGSTTNLVAGTIPADVRPAVDQLMIAQFSNQIAALTVAASGDVTLSVVDTNTYSVTAFYFLDV